MLEAEVAVRTRNDRTGVSEGAEVLVVTDRRIASILGLRDCPDEQEILEWIKHKS